MIWWLKWRALPSFPVGEIIAGHMRCDRPATLTARRGWYRLGWRRLHLSIPRGGFMSGSRAVSVLIGPHLWWLAWTWPVGGRR